MCKDLSKICKRSARSVRFVNYYIDLHSFVRNTYFPNREYLHYACYFKNLPIGKTKYYAHNYTNLCKSMLQFTNLTNL